MFKKIYGEISRLYHRKKDPPELTALKEGLHRLFNGKKCFVRISVIDKTGSIIDHYIFTRDFPITDLLPAHRYQADWVAKELAKIEVPGPLQGKE